MHMHIRIQLKQVKKQESKLGFKKNMQPGLWKYAHLLTVLEVMQTMATITYFSEAAVNLQVNDT
jgi:hypothetical protein